MKYNIIDKKIYLYEFDKFSTIDISDISEEFNTIVVEPDLEEIPKIIVSDNLKDIKLYINGKIKSNEMSDNFSSIYKHVKEVHISSKNDLICDIDNICVVDNNGTLIWLISDTIPEGVKILPAYFYHNNMFGNTVTLPKSLKMISNRFENQMESPKTLIVNSKLSFIENEKRVIKNDYERIYYTWSSLCKKSMFDYVVFTKNKYIANDFISYLFDFTTLYSKNYKLDLEVNSLSNIQFFFGFLRNLEDIKDYEFLYNFYVNHKKAIYNFIDCMNESSLLIKNLKKLKRIWKEKGYHYQVNKKDFTFYNTYKYQEFDDHIDLLALFANDLTRPHYDKLVIPSKINNKVVNLPFYFHVTPMTDMTRVKIKELIIEKRDILHTYFFPCNDHDGDAFIESIILKNGIKRIEAFMNMDEDYTEARTIYIPKSVKYIEKNSLIYCKNIIKQE